MKKEINMVEKFHRKFNVPVLKKSALIPEDRFLLRYKLMKDEVEEYLQGVERNDIINVTKELSDILFAVYGTILEHGLQDVIEKVFKEVYNSNMSKDYSQYKMIKGSNYFEADIKKFFSEE